MHIAAEKNKPIPALARQHFSGVAEGAEGLVFESLREAGKRTLLFVARDDARMHTLAETLPFFLKGVEILTFPAWDCLPYDRISPHHQVVSERMQTLSRLAKGVSDAIVITTANAFLQRVPAKKVIAASTLLVKTGEKIGRDILQDYLVRNSYRRVGTANDPGEFAMRGSIVDIMPAGSDKGVRLDFFGDEIESIRQYDPLSQVSETNVDSLSLIPASEVLLSEETIQHFRKEYREKFGAAGTEDPLYVAISEGRQYAGMEHWLPLFYDELAGLLDYVPNATVLLDHLVPQLLQEREETIAEYYGSRKTVKNFGKSDSGLSAGTAYRPLPPEMLYLSMAELEGMLQHADSIATTPFAHAQGKNFGYSRAPDLFAESAAANTTAFEKLKSLLPNTGEQRVIGVACYSAGSLSRMAGLLKDYDIQNTQINAWAEAKPGFKGVYLAQLPLVQGFTFSGFTLFSESDILGEKIIRKPKRKSGAEAFLSEASSFTEGELVVHKEHGVGRFEGLETLTVLGVSHDCLKLIYHGDDKLYVPVENLDLISRYGSSEGVALDKLGGAHWQARKAKAKQRIRMAAEELLKIAAERAVKRADIMEKPEGLFDEFCARFPYSETEDQLRTIEEVLTDMASGKPMDRLVCGDVGFGKTEVALRAAFVAATFGQVAIITPTTLLCRQHFATFTARFKNMPFRIRQLSRLVSAKELAQTKKDIADGKVDIVIGTHALLAKTIQFKHLSLVVVDEEQHFGVKQKEALKNLRAETHVLTLTATPIPRTLQMSLTGVRDLSIIATPPVDRLAVRTYVMPYDPVVMREALLREHFRGGSSFVVCPRINDLDEMLEHLKKLVPEVKIEVAHGQMAAQVLDDIMTRFYDGKFDVLLSTTIVESGIDVPRANTLIIHRADRFGLAQLYQLRGRVGRSRTRAYAYLTTPARKTISKDAEKRLEVMQMLDSLGAGFQLASYDMDIRGYGNLLGEEQSGNVREVGIELYQQMLEDAVAGMKPEAKVEESFSPVINLGASVLIPEKYVQDMDLRLGLYKRLGNVSTELEAESLAAEMIDRFGELPIETAHLVETIKIKLACRRAGIEKIDAGEKGAVMSFHKDRFAEPEALINWVSRDLQHRKVRPDQKLAVTNQQWQHIDLRFKAVYELVSTIAALAQAKPVVTANL